MKFILIPVKDLSKANERLSPIMSQTQRTSLAYAMLEDVLEEARKSSKADRRCIVTMDKKAACFASRYGFEVIWEEEQQGESSSVDKAVSRCIEMGASSVLVLPADTPLVRASDIDEVFNAELEENCVVMVPAQDRLGTNALLRRPPNIIPSRFGYDSYRKHLVEAKKVGAKIIVLDIPRIALDVDEPKDVDTVINSNVRKRTFNELERLGFTTVSVEKTA